MLSGMFHMTDVIGLWEEQGSQRWYWTAGQVSGLIALCPLMDFGMKPKTGGPLGRGFAGQKDPLGGPVHGE